MVGAVHQGHLHIHHGIAQDPGGRGFPDPFLHRRNVFPGDRPAHDFILKDHAAARGQGLKLQHHMAVLAPAAGLPDKFAFRLGLGR